MTADSKHNTTAPKRTRSPCPDHPQSEEPHEQEEQPHDPTHRESEHLRHPSDRDRDVRGAWVSLPENILPWPESEDDAEPL